VVCARRPERPALSGGVPRHLGIIPAVLDTGSLSPPGRPAAGRRLVVRDPGDWPAARPARDPPRDGPIALVLSLLAISLPPRLDARRRAEVIGQAYARGADLSCKPATWRAQGPCSLRRGAAPGAAGNQSGRGALPRRVGRPDEALRELAAVPRLAAGFRGGRAAPGAAADGGGGARGCQTGPGGISRRVARERAAQRALAGAGGPSGSGPVSAGPDDPAPIGSRSPRGISTRYKPARRSASWRRTSSLRARGRRHRTRPFSSERLHRRPGGRRDHHELRGSFRRLPELRRPGADHGRAAGGPDRVSSTATSPSSRTSSGRTRATTRPGFRSATTTSTSARRRNPSTPTPRRWRSRATTRTC